MRRLVWLLLLVPALFMAPPAFAANCASAAGEWNWVSGGVLTFANDHTVLYNGAGLGKWECTDAQREVVTIRWANGYVDTITISGNNASGKNQIGMAVSGTRILKSGQPGSSSPAASPVSASSAVQAPPSSGPPITMLSSSALQQCLGFRPGAEKMAARTEAAQFCRQLPGADLYDQAGARFKAGDHAGAVKILASAAQAGNVQAQLRLAMMLETGDGTARDKAAAFSWYTRAASVGEPASQMELGGYYEEADGVRENWDLAARLYQASASQGWVKGQFALGRCYQFGIGVPQNRQQAIAWFQKAAAQGDAQGQYYARWLSDFTNNIGFRNDAEHDLVIAGKLRFALGAADPAGITFHNSGQRVAWLQQLAGQVNASESLTMWQLHKDEYDSCMRKSGTDCHTPGPRPGR